MLTRGGAAEGHRCAPFLPRHTRLSAALRVPQPSCLSPSPGLGVLCLHHQPECLSSRLFPSLFSTSITSHPKEGMGLPLETAQAIALGLKSALSLMSVCLHSLTVAFQPLPSTPWLVG